MEITFHTISPRFAEDTWLLRNNPDIWKFANPDSPLPATLETERKFYFEMAKRSDLKMFAILYNGKMIGAVTLRKIVNGTAEIGYYILLPDLWNKGIATRAVLFALNSAFGTHNLDVVYAYINPDNIYSDRIVKRLGFYCAGKSRTNDNVLRYEFTRTMWKHHKPKRYDRNTQIAQ